MKKIVSTGGIKKQKTIFRCPYYSIWVGMISRCYSNKSFGKNAVYADCTVSEEWLIFSNFRAWMIKQNWEGMQLDKDILIDGNRMYSSDTCVFVTRQTNVFVTDSAKARGDLPVGVSWHKSSKKYQSRCKNPFTNKSEYLGLFSCKWKAHDAWLAKKLEYANTLSLMQTDKRVALALIERYTNYKHT